MSNRFQKRKKEARQESYFDYTLLFVVLFLLGFGMVMIYSTSSYQSAIDFDNPAYYLKRQLSAGLLGIAAMIFVSFIPYKFWRRFDSIGYIASAVLICLVLTPLGMEKYGARRWLNIMGVSLQPAEIAKLCMIIFLASFVCKLGDKISETKGFLCAMGVSLPICGLIYFITDNLSTAIIVFGIAALMVFVASPDYKKFLVIIGVGAVVVGLVVFSIVNSAETGGFRSERVLAWLNPELYADDKGFQTLQSLYAIGSGGVFGKGLGQSMQKLGFLPEAQNDMIFSIICEELGLFGATAIILMFLILIWRFMIIATNAKDLFGSLIVVGVLGHFAIQVILNIAVVTNTIPNTGITLPFISYGGSSVLFTLIEIGLVLSVSRSIKVRN